MLDGRVLEASQVEYKPFGKPPLKREMDESTKNALNPTPMRMPRKSGHILQRRRSEVSKRANIWL